MQKLIVLNYLSEKFESFNWRGVEMNLLSFEDLSENRNYEPAFVGAF